MQKRASNNYFNFTKKERNGIILVILIIALLTTIPFFYSMLFKDKVIDSADIKNELSILKTKQKDSSKEYYHKDPDKPGYQNYYHKQDKDFYSSPAKGELFYFDPNTISTDKWKRLGLRDKTINTIQNFISKGGKFKEPDDIKKIWGLHEDEIERLLPFVKIQSTVSSTEIVKPLVSAIKYEKKNHVESIDINLADTTALINLPGIGSKLSNRIINFRNRLGGFYSIEQVAETFALPDSVFQKIKPYLQLHDKNLKQININTALIDELKQHPYIRYNLANLIIQYRTQHGKFSDISEIRKIMTVDDELYNKLSPYLTVK